MKIPQLAIGNYYFAPAFWPTVAFAMVFPVLLSLGLWQMQRAGDKQSLVEQRAAGEVIAPLMLTDTSGLSDSDRYRAATVKGHYVTGQQWLLDNRVFRGQPGYHVFTPFQPLGTGHPNVLINRGWVAVGESRDYLPELPLPDETVVLHGRLDSPASVALVIGEPPVSSVADKVLLQSLDIAALASARGLDAHALRPGDRRRSAWRSAV